eukprot:Pgem_evm1s13841
MSSNTFPLKSLFRDCIVDHQNSLVNESEIFDNNDVLAFYFSGAFCPPCKEFTPILVNTYNETKLKGEKFEVIFISSGQDENEFWEYFDTMP